MKKLLLIVIAMVGCKGNVDTSNVIASTHNYTVNKGNNLAERHLIGNIKSITYNIYYVYDSVGTLIKKYTFKTNVIFNDFGNLEKEDLFNEPNGRLIESIIPLYDNQNRIVNIVIKYIDGSFTEGASVNYNQNGDTAVIDGDYSPVNLLGMLPSYQDNGNNLVAPDYQKRRHLHILLNYDHYHKIISKKIIQGGNILPESFYLNYNVDSTLKSIKTSNGTIIAFAYNQDKRQIRMSQYMGGILLWKTFTEYNSRGNEIKSYVYNSNNKIDNNQTLTFKYGYDNIGNIIEQTEYKFTQGEMQPYRMTKSIIQYR